MANNTIKLTDLIDREERAYSYALSETIGELKRTISQEENYDKEVKIFLAFIPLPDDLYIKDLIDLEEHGFFVEFESYADVKADKDILVWAGKYDCQKLHAGVQEPIKVHRKTMSRTGNLGVARERFVHVLTSKYFYGSQMKGNETILFLAWTAKIENSKLGYTTSNSTGPLKLM